MAKKEEYGVEAIRVLKGLEPVKQRPGMYTLTDNPLHIIQEVIDNASDEVLAGYGKRISVEVAADGSVTVEDDGRGIPTGMHPEEHAPVLEIVFTRLHAGGKFAKADGSGPYTFAGGLHGVGVSVTNALSKHLVVTVWRDGQEATMGFRDGFVSEPLEIKKSSRPKSRTGTRVTVWPDPKYFDSPVIPEPALVRLLRSKAVLLPGCEVDYVNKMTGTEAHWKYSGGLKEYLLSEIKGDSLIEPFEASGFAGEDSESFSPGEGASWVVVWTAEGPLTRESYVNLIPTPQGGTHEAGLKDGLFQAVRAFMDAHGLQPKGVKILAEDVFSRVNFVLSTKSLDPQFQGQTKEKLTDCESSDITRNELFIVEGDSAGGSAKQGRDKEFQAVLPLRGKILNTWEVEGGELFRSDTIHDIALAIGVDPHHRDGDPDLKGLRYGKICILSDADVDGSHIQVLLLTLFLKHFPKLIELGHVYVAMPPLFRVDAPKKGRKPDRKIYCLDERELSRTLESLKKEGFTEEQLSISRFKGLGEMKAEQLAETTLAPDTRKLLPVAFGSISEADTRTVMQTLMGERQVTGRRLWMEAYGDRAELDV